MSNEKFMIGGWLSPKNTRRDYMLAKDCGLNAMYLLSSAAGWLGDDEQVEAVRICKEVGMDAIPVVNNKTLQVYDERIFAFDNVPAILLWDEPSVEKFPLLVEKIEEFYKHCDSSIRCEINLNPSYAPARILGTENYFEYVQRYIDEVHSKMTSCANVFSLDFYPLFKREEGTVITPMWLPCLSVIAHFAALKNLSTHCFIQTMPFSQGNDVVQTFETLRMQFMIYMAFGFRAFSHFCYASPGINQEFLEHQEAIVGRNGEPTPLYDCVREANAFVQKFAKRYLPYSYVGTAKFAPSLIEDFEGWANDFSLKDTAIVGVETDCPILIGAFKKEETEAFFLTHYALPNEKTGKCTLRFAKKQTLRIFYNGEEKIMETDGLELEVETGNGTFIEIIK